MTLKILHTSDWHLGKKLHRLDRIEEQEQFIEFILEKIIAEKIDHLFIAGDIFDSPQPSHQAFKLWTLFLSKFLEKTNSQLWAIAGNHDSATLIEIPQILVDKNRIHLIGHISSDPNHHWFVLEKNELKIDLCLLPYFRPHEIAQWKNHFPTTHNDQEIIPNLIQSFLNTASQKKNHYKLLLSHHLFGSFESAGSEQSVFLSGMTSVPLNWCEGFDYLALGHIHKPQKIKSSKPIAYYSGSPIPMRFSETEAKSCQILELTKNSFNVTPLMIPVYRKLMSLKFSEETWEEELKKLKLPESKLPPALEIIIQRTNPKSGAQEKIRSAIEKMNCELLSLVFESNAPADQTPIKLSHLKDLSLTELFVEFYKYKYPEASDVSSELLNDFRSLLSEANRHEN